MQKFSYINQMNGFLTRMSDDALPANAVMLYLILFNRFNRSCWRQEWMKFTLQQLMAFSHIGSPNTVYSMRSLLKELGYIDYRPSRNGSRSQTEYRLLPLTSATDMPQAPANVLSHNEPAKNENTQRGFSPELSKSENSETETSNEFSPELSKSENHRHELSKNEYRTPPVCAKSEYSKTETSGELSDKLSDEFSQTERQADNSLIEKDKDKKRNTAHDTAVTSRADNNNNNNNNNNNTDNTNNTNNINKAPMTVSEFCQTNGNYLLCLDAYRDYFKKEPPSEDRVKLIRFLAEYGVDNTLQAMDIMMQSRAASLSYCEGVLRRMQWQINRTAAKRPAPRPHSDWQGWKMA